MWPPFIRVSRLCSFSVPDLGSFAVKHYLRVLELAGEWQQESPEVAFSVGIDSWLLNLA